MRYVYILLHTVKQGKTRKVSPRAGLRCSLLRCSKVTSYKLCSFSAERIRLQLLSSNSWQLMALTPSDTHITHLFNLFMALFRCEASKCTKKPQLAASWEPSSHPFSTVVAGGVPLGCGLGYLGNLMKLTGLSGPNMCPRKAQTLSISKLESLRHVLMVSLPSTAMRAMLSKSQSSWMPFELDASCACVCTGC